MNLLSEAPIPSENLVKKKPGMYYHSASSTVSNSKCEESCFGKGPFQKERISWDKPVLFFFPCLADEGVGSRATFINVLIIYFI